MKRAISAMLMVLLAPVVWAEESLATALKDDVVLRALVDELDRNMNGLELEGLQRPYFIEYGLLDSDSFWLSAEFGAVTSKAHNRSRSLSTDVRVGSYELDNTNFGGGGYGGYGGGAGAAMPIEDDYDAIRQSIWWTTDRDYKGVVEILAQKKAFMESKLIEDKPPDFAHEPPVVYIEPPRAPLGNTARLEQLAVQLSALFREYPDLIDSDVNVAVASGSKYIVNTEGTRLRTTGQRFVLMVNAKVKADDGMELNDSLSLQFRQWEDLPPQDELARRCRAMVEQLIALKKAPVLTDAYTGPVLFDPEAATSLFAAYFGGRFDGGQRPVGSRTPPDDFSNKLNRRILPRFLNVVDDPTQERIAGLPVMGHYKYDDQAVAAQAVTLVEGGRLKALLMSRNPSKEFSESNGHGRGFGEAEAAVACLIVRAEPASTPDSMRQDLLETCQEEGLAYGMRVAKLAGHSPLVMYKVFPDGHEELVRGAEFARIDLKAFKRMVAAGDTPFVLNAGGRTEATTVACPALLFEELDLAKMDRDFDKPPILPNPLGRK